MDLMTATLTLSALQSDDFRIVGIIPAATENDSCIRWYKGRDCGPRSEQGIAAKAAPVANEGPAGAVRQGRTGVRHKTAKKVSTFLAVGISSSTRMILRFKGHQIIAR